MASPPLSVKHEITMNGPNAAWCMCTVGDTIYTAGGTAGYKIWAFNGNSGMCERLLEGHTGPVTALASLPNNRIISGSADTTLRVWDANSGTVLHILDGHCDVVTCVAALTPGPRALSGAYDNTLKIWDTDKNQLLLTIPVEDEVYCVASVGSAGQFASGHTDYILVWNPDGSLYRHIKHFGAVYSLLGLSSGDVMTGGCDKQSGGDTMWIWDVKAGKVQATLQGHKDGVHSMVQLPSGEVLSASADHTVRCWRRNGSVSAILTGHTGTVHCVAMLANGKVATGAAVHDSTVKVWTVPKEAAGTVTKDDKNSDTWTAPVCLWQWQDANGFWQDMPHEVCIKLGEHLVTNPTAACTYTVGPNPYSVNLQSMVQTNVKTTKHRNIRMVANQPPTDPTAQLHFHNYASQKNPSGQKHHHHHWFYKKHGY